MRSWSFALSAALLSSSVVAGPAMAQSARPTFEVGGQAALLRLNNSGTTSAGLGARFSVDLSDWVAVEADLSYFPRDNFEVGRARETRDQFVWPTTDVAPMWWPASRSAIAASGSACSGRSVPDSHA